MNEREFSQLNLPVCNDEERFFQGIDIFGLDPRALAGVVTYLFDPRNVFAALDGPQKESAKALEDSIKALEKSTSRLPTHIIGNTITIIELMKKEHSRISKKGLYSAGSLKMLLRLQAFHLYAFIETYAIVAMGNGKLKRIELLQKDVYKTITDIFISVYTGNIFNDYRKSFTVESVKKMIDNCSADHMDGRLHKRLEKASLVLTSLAEKLASE